jgi:primosomal protein N''
MKRFIGVLAITGSVLAFGVLTIASGQNELPAPTVESRLLELEEGLARLGTTLQMRTEVSGPQDRVNRDFNLDTRLNEIERRLQQLGFEMSNVSSQISSAVNAANQAQRDAQMAQQMARDVMNRVR